MCTDCARKDSMYLAETPRKVNRSSTARSRSRSAVGYMGWPSYKTMVAPVPKAITNQFHIIQPQVV